MKVVIIGGVAGGATAAARIRRLDEHAEIIIIERSGFVSYANCGLPYYIGDVIEDPEELTLQTPEGFKKRFLIDVRVNSEATAIDTEKKSVTVKDLSTGDVYTEDYDKLIISTGAKPVRPDVPGIDNEKIFYLRTVEDTFKIHDHVREENPKQAVIVGGGFIGLEMAENLRNKGLEVTVLQRSDHVMKNFDYDMATLIHAVLRAYGIKVKTGIDIAGFKDDGDFVRVMINGDDDINTDMVIMAVGVMPETELAKEAGLELGINDSIVVNDEMQTSDPDVYAVGDAVQKTNPVSGKEVLISLAGPANKQARVAADNICGIKSKYKGSIGSSVIKLFEMTAATTGLSEKAAKAAGFDCESVILSPASHAGYYPGARVMTMKVTFEKKTGKILGSQIIGYEGVDKRIDVLAAAIHFKAVADDLKELDLAYAPPFSSAKDPVNMAGFMIENIITGNVKQFFWNTVEELPLDGSVTLIDARTPGEYKRGHAEGFVNIPVDEVRERLGEIDKTKPVYVMCQSGIRSYITCRILSQEGYDCYNFSGGYRFYESVTKEKNFSEKEYPCGMDK